MLKNQNRSIKKIEAIDVGRRSIHDEGAILLQEIFKQDIDVRDML